MIDEPIATSLLTGIVADTNSFQNANTTPKSLTVAAQLVAAGAKQQDIIRHIFKTRSLAQLRLWGRALSYIKEEADLKFAWSTLSKADFVAAQAEQSTSSGVIDELLKTASGMNFVLLLTERDGGIHGSFRSVIASFDVSRLANMLGGGGHAQAAAFFLPNANLKQKEAEIISRIRNELQGEGKKESPKPVQPKQPEQKRPEPKKPTPPIRDFSQDPEGLS